MKDAVVSPFSPSADRSRLGALVLLVAFVVASWTPWFHALGEDHVWCDTHGQIEHGDADCFAAIDGNVGHAHDEQFAAGPSGLHDEDHDEQDESSDEDGCFLNWIGAARALALESPDVSGERVAEQAPALQGATRAHLGEAVWRRAPKTSPPA